MAYKRKTEDVFELRANYGYGDGYECITAETTRKEIRARLKEYRENGDYAPMKIVRTRVPLEQPTASQ
jgi:hypothetical protein